MIYDCFPFFNELDLLEIRLNILDPYVDYFVLYEADKTFSGKNKPFYFAENKERFAKWSHKILYIGVKFEGDSILDSFEMARLQKDSLRQALKNREMSDDDIIIYGDVDEIWTPQEITDDKVYNLQQKNYCYYLNNRSSEQWVGTIVGKWGTVKTKDLAYWRANHTNELPNGGWHFTNIGGAEQIRKKLEAYDHQEFNNEQTKAQIESRIANGEDYVGRRTDWLGNPFEFFVDESELPSYVIINRQKYNHLFK